MKDEDIMVKCRKCSTEWAAGQMKLDIDEKMVVCPSCLRAKKSAPQSQEKKPSSVQQPEQKPLFSQKPSEPLEKPAKEKRVCNHCGYKFIFNIDTGTPRNCPYCSKPVIDEFPTYRM